MDFLALVFLTITLRVERKRKNQEKHKNQGQIALERVRAQNISINNNLYDACNECTYDACSNAQKSCSIFNIFI